MRLFYVPPEMGTATQPQGRLEGLPTEATTCPLPRSEGAGLRHPVAPLSPPRAPSGPRLVWLGTVSWAEPWGQTPGGSVLPVLGVAGPRTAPFSGATENKLVSAARS